MTLDAAISVEVSRRYVRVRVRVRARARVRVRTRARVRVSVATDDIKKIKLLPFRALVLRFDLTFVISTSLLRVPVL